MMHSTQTQASVKHPFHSSGALSGPLNTHLNIYVFTSFFFNLLMKCSRNGDGHMMREV